jgi:hypothetical protein
MSSQRHCQDVSEGSWSREGSGATGTQVVRETLQKGGYAWNCVSQFQSFPKSAVPVDDPCKDRRNDFGGIGDVAG